VGAAGAGAGLGTSALFSDTESFEGNMMTAGELDLAVDYVVHEDQGSAGSYTINSFTGEINESSAADVPTVNGDGTSMSQDLDDIKPGDSGHSYFCFTIDDNPAYMWACGELTGTGEQGPDGDGPYTEPEPRDNNGEGELEENIDVTMSYCDIDKSDGSLNSTGTEIFSGSLRELLTALQAGIPLDGTGVANPTPGSQAAYDGTNNSAGNLDVNNPCICFEWEVPISVENIIQGDTLSFDLSFYAEQARHNDGSENPCVDATYSTENGWGDTWDSDTIDTLSNLGASNSSESLNISYGSQQVVFEVDLADSFDTGSSDNDAFNLVFDTDDDGGLDFEVAWAADPSNTAPAGENFWYKDLSSNTAESLSNFSDITADLDTGSNTVTISVGRNRLANTYKVAWQALYRDGNSGGFDATKIPFTQPRWKYGTGSDHFATETLPNP
jgi:predicted ribosomally synthesized peptide with SipW-like signal peptide